MGCGDRTGCATPKSCGDPIGCGDSKCCSDPTSCGNPMGGDDPFVCGDLRPTGFCSQSPEASRPHEPNTRAPARTQGGAQRQTADITGLAPWTDWKASRAGCCPDMAAHRSGGQWLCLGRLRSRRRNTRISLDNSPVPHMPQDRRSEVTRHSSLVASLRNVHAPAR